MKHEKNAMLYMCFRFLKKGTQIVTNGWEWILPDRTGRKASTQLQEYSR